jgi:hypothetical protein
MRVSIGGAAPESGGGGGDPHNTAADDAEFSDTDSVGSAGSTGSARFADSKTRGVLTTGGGGGGSAGAGAGAGASAGAGAGGGGALLKPRRKRADVFLELLEIYLSDEFKRLHPLSSAELAASTASYAGSSDDEDFPDLSDSEGGGGADAADAADVSYRQRVVHVLNTYSAYIDAVKALKLIPSDIPLRAIAPFLKAVIPRKVHDRRNKQIVKNLQKMDNLKVWQPHFLCLFCCCSSGAADCTLISLSFSQFFFPVAYSCCLLCVVCCPNAQTKVQLIEARTQRFMITRDRRCCVCQKAISDSIFSVHPQLKADDRRSGADDPLSAEQDTLETAAGGTMAVGSLGSGGGFGMDTGDGDGAADGVASAANFIPLPDEGNYVLTHYRCNARYRRIQRELRKKAAGLAGVAKHRQTMVGGQAPGKASKPY